MTIPGVIYENYLKGRKRALWISVSNDLKYDAERDLADIGNTGIEVVKPFQLGALCTSSWHGGGGGHEKTEEKRGKFK